MIILTGNNLCKRQQELNAKVNEAVVSKINFEDIKDEPEATDVDKLFKIDVAAKYKNSPYVIEVLKCGDSLYISRVLKKCTWLFNNDYSNVINTDYLHHNIFPFMSVKMKRKLLTAVSTNLKSEARATDFYKYCLRVKLAELADKFLLQTSESFKLNYLENDVLNNDIKYVKSFIGHSFALLDAYISKQSEYSTLDIREFRHLYSVSEEKYLDLLEKHAKIDQSRRGSNNLLGLRISKHIMTKHKKRVLKNPYLYLNLLNSCKIVRHSNSEDAKVYVVSLMPKEASNFWAIDFYTKYKYIINVIPENERYTFLQKTFTSHYPSEEFETNKFFYGQNYYNLMSLDERENWALQQIEIGKELHGPGRDFVWYKFVNFEKAFVELKKYIKTATNPNKRKEIIQTLVDSTKNQREIEQVLKYYFERHINESRSSKEFFVSTVMSRHKVFKFDNDCWAAFDKLLLSLNVYNTNHGNVNFKIASILYHILNKKPLPDSLEEYLDSNLSTYSFKSYIDEFSDEEKLAVYEYISNFYLKKIESFLPIPKDSKELQETKARVILYIHFLLEFMAMYKKEQKDIPDVVMKFIKLDHDAFKYHQILEKEKIQELTENRLLKYLKEDAQRLVDSLKDLESAITYNRDFRINTLLKKLKIYFADDISKEYIKYFHQMLTNKLTHGTAATAVFGIFQLGDETTKILLMNKYSPACPKLDYNQLDLGLLTIQEKICRFACYSRPPVPLSIMLKYLVGDYVRFCLPMFNMYLANLPQPLCINFVQSIINSPVSIQKHGLRLAFQCFGAENLNKLILDSWKKTTNVSLRGVMYKTFFKKAVEEDSREYFNVLKTLTADLTADDDEEIFNALTRPRLSKEFLGEFVEVLWGTVQKFPNNETNLFRKRNIISCIDNNLKLMKKDILKSIINEHIMKNLFQESIVEMKVTIVNFIEAKWALVAHYIVYFTNSEADRKESIDLATFIVKHCYENWNKTVADVYIFRRLCFNFIKKLDGKSLSDSINNYEDTNCVFEEILAQLQSILPLDEIYICVWQIRLKILTSKLAESCRQKRKFEVMGGPSLIYGNAIGNLVKEFVEKKIYFSYFFKDIVEIVDVYARVLVHGNILAFDAGVTCNDVLMDIARGLLQCDMPETCAFALQLLPQDLDDNESDNYKDVFDKLRGKADMEVKCSLYAKYYSDCKRRRFL
ncbi:unnamed protein product [Chilo suppressalis]|uniref:Uncharacterized protein n=1 Tax=Chilo suppressalis TaxID=168631 RepID=A0ABN8BA57_CHISP|nr:unnamed protein product [Chilo suppressalis]